jgi:hypothetical protein
MQLALEEPQSQESWCGGIGGVGRVAHRSTLSTTHPSVDTVIEGFGSKRPRWPVLCFCRVRSHECNWYWTSRTHTNRGQWRNWRSRKRGCGLVDGVVFSSGHGVSLSVAALDSEVGGGFAFRYPPCGVPCSCGVRSHDA